MKIVNLNINNAFTLAEVLITLGIIGVVAALTIPTLVNNYQKTQYVTGLQKAYTEWNQALIQIAEDKGCVGDLECTGLFDVDSTQESFGNELVKYFKVAKNCESSDGGPTIAGCFADPIGSGYDGSAQGSGMDDSSYYRFITADGMAFWIRDWNTYNSNCVENYSLNKTYNLTQVCGEIYIDVNGLKGPNNTGRDIFYFLITNGKGPLLYPVGGADDSAHTRWRDDSGNLQTCYPNNPDGMACAARVIEEGWKMNY